MLAETFMIRMEVTARTVAKATPISRFVPFDQTTFGGFRVQRTKTTNVTAGAR